MSTASLFSVLALLAGAALGVVVTRGLHRNPAKVFWNTRLGNTPWRRANLPVGGTLAALVAAALCVAGRPDAALIAVGAGVGMAAGAMGVGIAEPLERG